MISFSIVMYGCRSCNMNCSYCSASPEAESEKQSTFVFNKEKVLETIKSSQRYKQGTENLQPFEVPKFRFDIWGGNPLFHFKEFSEVVDFLRENFVGCEIAASDNGLSLTNNEIVDYIISHNILIQLSHDGLGQKYRSKGFDPLYDESSKENVLKLLKYHNIVDINCTLSKVNPSFIQNIMYFNKWRYDNKVQDEPLNIKLNHISDNDNKEFRFDEETSEIYFSELRKLGILYRKNFDSEFHKPYIPYIMDITTRYNKATHLNTFFSACQSFQRGKLSENFVIDTSGEYSKCDLIDSGSVPHGNGGYPPDYCKNCKYKVLPCCRSCGSEPFGSTCIFRRKMAQVIEEFYLMDHNDFLFEEFPFSEINNI